jgi:hypothetical protein
MEKKNEKKKEKKPTWWIRGCIGFAPYITATDVGLAKKKNSTEINKPGHTTSCIVHSFHVMNYLYCNRTYLIHLLISMLILNLSYILFIWQMFFTNWETQIFFEVCPPPPSNSILRPLLAGGGAATSS